MRFKSSSSDGGELINISSMIDVMFILIIFFLVTTTFKEEEVDQLVKLPTDKRNQSLTQSSGSLIKINIRENGAYLVMGTQMTEEQLNTWMEGEIKRKPELKVLIRCDKEGGWRYKPGERGDLSATGWYIMALGSAQMSGIPVPEKILSGARSFLESVRGGPSGGSYGYTDSPGTRDSGRHGMNAAGFFCSQLLGASPNGASAFESAQLLGNSGLKVSDLYYIYYGTVAAYQHQGPLWREWREEMQGKFLREQARGGSWQAGGGHGKAMGRIIGTALTVLCLEAHYRYTPLYGLGYEPNPDGPVAGALDQAQVPETPLFRHAKYLEAFNSRAHDTAPVVTDHGDFLYFSSERGGGFGGSDIYRARISGSLPGAVANLGEEINSSANEGQPAVRMVGFHLLFNSDREGRPDALYSAKSRRLDLRHDYTRFPGLRWLGRNWFWLFLLIGAPVVGVWQLRRALLVTENPGEVLPHV